MNAHDCTTITTGCYRCELATDEMNAMLAEDREDAESSWIAYRNAFMLGRPHKQHTMLRRREFIAGFIAGRQS